MKKLIAFDQDDTINITKLPIDSEMTELLSALMKKYKVCIISGTNWEVMKQNDIDPIVNRQEELAADFSDYIIMPTTGTQLWYHEKGEWIQEYAHFLTEEQVTIITEKLEKVVKDLGYWCQNPKGDIIENRGSQVTFSALGQWALPEEKYNWDPDTKKRKAIVEKLSPLLKDQNVQIAMGGSTSIDITLPGIDKAYGMQQLLKFTGLAKEDVLFIGDMLQEGGNDYPVKTLGIDTIEVNNCEDTKRILRGILHTS